MPKRDVPPRAAKRGAPDVRKGKGRARTRAGGLKLIDDPKLDERKLSYQLKQMGLYAAHTLGDGNCLFRALSDQLKGTPDHHLTIRQTVCDFLAANEARYKAFVDTDEEESWENHLREMRRSGTYGGHLELSAFAHLHRRPIKVIQPGLVYVIGHEDESPAALKRKAWRDAKGKQRQAHQDLAEETVEEEVAVDAPLYIIYHQWEHYSSVRNIDGPHAGPPRIRERQVPPSETALAGDEPALDRVVNVTTDETMLLRRSLPDSASYTDDQLARMINEHGSWEKVLEDLLAERDSGSRPASSRASAEGTDVTMHVQTASPSVSHVMHKRTGSHVSAYREPSPASSSSTADGSTRALSRSSATSSTEPSSGSVSLGPLGATHKISAAKGRVKHKSRSRSPEPAGSPGADHGRRLRRKAEFSRLAGNGDSAGEWESDASGLDAASLAASTAGTPVRPAVKTPTGPAARDPDKIVVRKGEVLVHLGADETWEHINTVKAEVDLANQQPTRLRPRAAQLSGGGGGAAAGKRGKREERRAKRRGALAGGAAGASATAEGKGGPETAALFKELRV